MRDDAFLYRALAMLAAGCAEIPYSSPYVDPAPHKVAYVTVATGISLQYLDFGGSGESVILLAGAYNSAHIYDDFAPLLTDSFHVFALTRRGSGGSSMPETGYDAATLAGDILAFMDSLGLE
jgi:pimeloyl-ACP methyl ester carboxylesterase